MARMEQIVRPFQRPDSLATRRILSKRRVVEVTPAIKRWGKAGTIPTPHQIDAIDPDGISFTLTLNDEEYTETGSRLTDVRRIVQTLPDGTTNPDNFIDLDRPYKVTFEKVAIDSKGPNTTQVFSTSIETTGFKTMNPDNKPTRSKFNLNRNLT